MSDIKKVLFFRNFKGFTGGHLKVWNYFNHFKYEKSYHPYISFSQDSVWNDSNPWLSLKDEVLGENQGINPDLFFLAGLDWLRSRKEDKNIPIVNLIQHVRHVNPDLPLYSFLKNKAIRICVSEQVREALIKSKQVNGPIYTIPNGLDQVSFPHSQSFQDRNIDVLIAGLKNKSLAMQLYERLLSVGINVTVLTQPTLQKDYLSYVGQAKITIFLPHATEGFYLPALEGMALETLVICPDCIGNQSFCFDNINCLQPEYSFDGLWKSINTALSMDEFRTRKMLSNARAIASKHTIEGERAAFLDVVNNISQIW